MSLLSQPGTVTSVGVRAQRHTALVVVILSRLVTRPSVLGPAVDHHATARVVLVDEAVDQLLDVVGSRS